MSDQPKTRGRPPRAPMQGKGSNFATRITAETRAALEAEAERTGRSKSQIAEMWLEQGRALSGLGPASAPVTALFTRILGFTSRVAAAIGDPTKSARAQEVVIAGLHEIVDDAFPPALDELADETSAVRHAAHAAANEIPDAGTTEKLAALRSLLLDLAEGRIRGEDPQWVRLGHALEDFAQTHGRGLLGTEQDRLLAGRVQIVVGHMIAAELVAQKLGRRTPDAVLEARILLGKDVDP